MKTAERHRLKENDLSHALNEATATLAARQRSFTLLGGVVVAVLLVAGGYWAWQTRTDVRSQAMLGDAMAVIQAPVDTPKPDANGKVAQAPGTYPTVTARAEAGLIKFQQVADAYPSSKSGIAARYYAASALGMLGRSTDAAARYQEVVDRAGTQNFYGQMAQLGVIESQLQAKQFDQAIAKAEALANATDPALPRDAMLMQLGRAYVAAGKKTEAKQTLDKIVAEFPESAYVDEAKTMITTL